jgi:5-carboxymethyl-2-hydroxymuconate isomerase
MPRIIFSYPTTHQQSINPEVLGNRLFTAAKNSGLFQPDGSDIKVSYTFNHSVVINGKQRNNFHIEFQLMEGRNAAKKQKLKASIEEALLDLHPNIKTHYQITIHFMDLKKDDYFKL